MTKYYAPTSSEVSPSEKAHMEAVRKFAPECIVLLENDGALPLKGTGNIALYGAGGTPHRQRRDRIGRC